MSSCRGAELIRHNRQGQDITHEYPGGALLLFVKWKLALLLGRPASSVGCFWMSTLQEEVEIITKTLDPHSKK